MGPFGGRPSQEAPATITLAGPGSAESDLSHEETKVLTETSTVLAHDKAEPFKNDQIR